MEQGMITCPNCGQEFEMSDALTGRIRKHLKEELLQDVKKREAEVKKKSTSLMENLYVQSRIPKRGIQKFAVKKGLHLLFLTNMPPALLPTTERFLTSSYKFFK